MSDDECDLDALVSLLDDDSNSGDVGQLEVSSGKSQDKGNGSCPPHRTKDTGSPQQADQKDEECNMEDLTAFLEEEDDFEEEVSQEKSPQMKDSPCKESSVSDERRESSHHHPSCNEEEEEEDSDIQDNGQTQIDLSHPTLKLPIEWLVTSVSGLNKTELMNIQKKMLELQSQLKKRKKRKTTEKSKSLIVSEPPEPGQHQPACGQKPNIQKTGAQSPKISPQRAGCENSNSSAPQTVPKHSPSEKKSKEKQTSVHKTVSPKSGTKSAGLKGEKGIVADCMEENPFFAQSDPQDEEEGPRGLFGDSDSDWDDLDGESKAGLSESGQILRNLMKKGDPHRVSRASPGDVQELRQRALKSNSWKNRPFPGQEMVDPAQKDATETYKSMTDPFSGIRIINPKISSTEMKYKMADRTLIKISKIHLKLKSADLQGNWVTIGVVVHKSEPRTSAAGKSFCVWRLSDLDDCDRTISFFLFGEVFKQHWKNEVKSVVGILNPNKMDKADKGQQDMAFTVNHPNQVLVMGHSQDLGRCAGLSKAGKACTNFINKEQGQFCVYHIQSAYKKSSAKRSELQGGSSVTPKNRVFGQRKNTESLFFYGGETFTNTRRKTSQKDQVTVRNLQAKQLQSKGKFTTMSLHKLDPNDQEKLQHLEQKKSDLVDLLATPTVGSLNFVKHLVKKENPKESEVTGDKKMELVSVSPAELLRQHKQDMLRKQRARQGAPPPQDISPQLGRGGIRGGFVSLDMAKKAKPISNMELAKLMAISKVKQSGGIDKDDPNALKRKRESPESKQKIKERVLSNLENPVDENKKQDEPPMKRSKLLGNIDENSEEFKKLMKSSSKHKGALAEVEREQEDRYFMELEKKEKCEDKMQSTMSVKCTVFTCKNCSYTAMKLADKCKTEGHIITKSQTSKRFFKCKHCGKRKISIQKYPTEPCDCGEYNFQRTAMLEERKGPKLPSESLSLRGDEVSYLGSMNQRVYLNI